jgi:hypothetical protein
VRYNAHLTQSQSQVADLGAGITDIGPSSPAGYWGNVNTNPVYYAVSAPLLSDVKNSAGTPMSADVVFRHAFINRIFSRKLDGGTAGFNRFFDGNGNKTVYPHELPTAGQVSDFLLRREHGIVDYHLGDMRPGVSAKDNLYYVFETGKYVAGTGYSIPEESWKNTNFRDKIISIFDRLFNLDSTTAGFNLHAANFSGGVIISGVTQSNSGRFINLIAGTGTDFLNEILSIENNHLDTNPYKSIMIRDTNHNLGSFKRPSGIAFKFESGEGIDDYECGGSTTSYGFVDVSRYYLRKPNNSHKVEAGSNWFDMTWMSAGDDGTVMFTQRSNGGQAIGQVCTPPMWFNTNTPNRFLLNTGGTIAGMELAQTCLSRTIINDASVIRHYFRQWDAGASEGVSFNMARLGVELEKSVGTTAANRLSTKFFIEQYDAANLRRVTTPIPGADCEFVLTNALSVQHIIPKLNFDSGIIAKGDSSISEFSIGMNRPAYALFAICENTAGSLFTTTDDLSLVKVGDYVAIAEIHLLRLDVWAKITHIDRVLGKIEIDKSTFVNAGTSVIISFIDSKKTDIDISTYEYLGEEILPITYYNAEKLNHIVKTISHPSLHNVFHIGYDSPAGLESANLKIPLLGYQNTFFNSVDNALDDHTDVVMDYEIVAEEKTSVTYPEHGYTGMQWTMQSGSGTIVFKKVLEHVIIILNNSGDLQNALLHTYDGESVMSPIMKSKLASWTFKIVSSTMIHGTGVILAPGNYTTEFEYGTVGWYLLGSSVGPPNAILSCRVVLPDIECNTAIPGITFSMMDLMSNKNEKIYINFTDSDRWRNIYLKMSMRGCPRIVNA